MDTEKQGRSKIWELESQSQAGPGHANRLELWQRDDGAFMFLAHNGSAESVTPYYIEHTMSLHQLISACVFVLNQLAHVPPMMPVGLHAHDEIVITYFNGHQEQTEAGHVIDWAIVKEYLHIESGDVVDKGNFYTE